VHPQTFPQLVQLTDGSVILLRAVSPKRPFVVLSTDSLNHPSWTGGRRTTGTMTDERLTRFNKRFGGIDEALLLGASEVTASNSSSVVKLPAKPEKAAADSKAGKGKPPGKKK
jgi:ribosomal protein L31